jgi:hypothetical protein
MAQERKMKTIEDENHRRTPNQAHRGWKLREGEIIPRGSEAFQVAVKQAEAALRMASRETARGELQYALADLSRMPEPDLTEAVQNAMAALKCVARDACGDSKATLGDTPKRNPGLIPKPLDTPVEKAWGYALEMGRHVREGRKPERK